MKKFIGFVLSLLLLTGLTVSTASAQHNYGRYNNGRIGTIGKVAIGTGVGAAVGGLIGGRRGVVIGGLAGAGGGYLWSRRGNNRYYQRPYYGNQRGYYNQPNYNNQPYYNNYPRYRH